MSFKGTSVTAASLSDVGRQRQLNQDSAACCLLPGDEPAGPAEPLAGRALLLSVCDGMGGGQGGEVASGLAVTALRRALATVDPPFDRDHAGRALIAAVEGANRVVRSAAKSLRLHGMGTTATAALVLGPLALVAQIGDSRAYVLRNGRLGQLTRDQSLAQQMIEAGLLRPEDARDFEHGNIILQALGTSDSVLVDLTWARLCRGDRLLLCSDGLWGELTDELIAQKLAAAPSAPEACRALVDAANLAGGSDNVTAVVCFLDGDELPSPAPDEVPPGYLKLSFQEAAPPPAPPVNPDPGQSGPSGHPSIALDPLQPATWIPEDPPEIPLHRINFLGAALLVAGAVALGFALIRCVLRRAQKTHGKPRAGACGFWVAHARISAHVSF